MSEPSHQEPGDDHERGGAWIGGDGDGLRLQLGPPDEADDGGAVRRALDGEIGAEALQHPLGMVARRHRLDDGGDAFDIEAGQQHRRLHLRGRHGHAIDDRGHRVGAADGQRQAIAGARDDLGAHLPQRLQHAAHRPPRQRGIADEGGGEGMGAGDPDAKPHAGAGIAEIDDSLRFQQAAGSQPVDAPQAVAPALHARAEGAHGAGGRHDVLGFEQPGDAGFADGERAKHEGAVGDRFVAGNDDAAGQRSRGSRAHRSGGGVCHGLSQNRTEGGVGEAAGW